MKDIYFCLNTDKNCLKPCYVLISSVLENISKDYLCHFYILFNGVKFNSKYSNKIKSIYNCKIDFINVGKYNQIFRNQKTKKFKLSYITKTTYFRLLLFKDGVFNNVDKIIYLDVDMIVNQDLSKIYDSFPEDKMLGAVVEIQATRYKSFILSHLYRNSWFSNMNDNYNSAPYFNAGFFVANLKKCREYKVFDSILKFLNEYPNSSYADQDVLNAVFGQKYVNFMLYLSPKYNVFCNMNYAEFNEDAYYKLSEIRDAFASPAIYHYGGIDKPWNSCNVVNYSSVWWKYAERLPFMKFRRKNSYTIYKLFNLIPFYIKKNNK